MDAKRRFGGSTISLAWTLAFARELLIGRPPGKTLEMMWEIISPQSFNLFMFVLGCGSLAYFSWPAAQWAWGIRARGREREREELEQHKKKQQGERAIVIETITNLKEILGHIYRHVNPSPEDDTRELIYRELLIQHKVVPENYREEAGGVWASRLDSVLPYIIQHGVKNGIAEYEKGIGQDESKDDGGS